MGLAFQYGEHWGGPSSPPGGFITNVDAMVALSTPEDSGPGFWSDAQQLEICNFGEGDEFVGPVIRTIIAGVWVAFFRECQQ